MLHRAVPLFTYTCIYTYIYIYMYVFIHTYVNIDMHCIAYLPAQHTRRFVSRAQQTPFRRTFHQMRRLLMPAWPDRAMMHSLCCYGMTLKKILLVFVLAASSLVLIVLATALVLHPDMHETNEESRWIVVLIYPIALSTLTGAICIAVDHRAVVHWEEPTPLPVAQRLVCLPKLVSRFYPGSQRLETN